jgi:preprotein translocase subunit YajC
MMPLFAGMLLLFWFLLIAPQRKEQAQRKAMLGAIKKNDRVITNSGIFGVVTNIAPESDEVTIKVDEANNTKLRMTLSSIARRVGETDQENKS